MNKQKILRAVTFLFGLFIILIVGSRIFCPPKSRNIYDRTSVRIKDKELDRFSKNSLDAVFLGDSICYSSFSPDRIRKEYKFNSYVCGTSAQRICDTYAILDNVFKKQQPKVIVLETNCLYRKLITEKDKEDVVKNVLTKYFPIVEEHSGWKNEADKVFGLKNIRADKNGFIERKSIKKYTGGEYMKLCNEKEQFPPQVEKYLNQIKKCCDDNGAKLLLVSCPSPKNWNYGRHNMVSSWAESNNVEYVDLNLSKDVSIDWNRDTKDGGDHLNVYGAFKVSDYMGKFLKKEIS